MPARQSMKSHLPSTISHTFHVNLKKSKVWLTFWKWARLKKKNGKKNRELTIRYWDINFWLSFILPILLYRHAFNLDASICCKVFRFISSFWSEIFQWFIQWGRNVISLLIWFLQNRFSYHKSRVFNIVETFPFMKMRESLRETFLVKLLPLATHLSQQ